MVGIFGWDRRIRTLTDRARICSATITPYLNDPSKRDCKCMLIFYNMQIFVENVADIIKMNAAFRLFAYGKIKAGIKSDSGLRPMHNAWTWRRDITESTLTEFVAYFRDVFLFCFFSGLRHSDANNLRRSDIKGDHIEVTRVTTADSISIELIPIKLWTGSCNARMRSSSVIPSILQRFWYSDELY